VREDWRVSVRKACEALRIDCCLDTYKSKRGEQPGLKQRIKDVCKTRVRYGTGPLLLQACSCGASHGNRRDQKFPLDGIS
jgi:hypothetical protein